MTTNVALVLQGLEAFNAGDFDGVLALAHPDIEAYIPPTLPNSGTYRGTEEFREMMERWDSAWEEFRAEPRDVIEHGEHIVIPVRQRARGKGSGIEIEGEVAYLITVHDQRMIGWRLFARVDEALAFARG